MRFILDWKISNDTFNLKFFLDFRKFRKAVFRESIKIQFFFRVLLQRRPLPCIYGGTWGQLTPCDGTWPHVHTCFLIKKKLSIINFIWLLVSLNLPGVNLSIINGPSIPYHGLNSIFYCRASEKTHNCQFDVIWENIKKNFSNEFFGRRTS